MAQASRAVDDLVQIHPHVMAEGVALGTRPRFEDVTWKVVQVTDVFLMLN